jgi:NarL family two-component system response regulator LiaR
MPESKLRVIIADDHAMIRKGLRFLLEGEADIEVVAEASDGHQVVSLARQLRPSEIVMDIAMPESNGIDATREILSEMPETRVLIISSNCDRDTIDEALSSGAFGYLSKGDSLLVVPFALREIHRGGRFISTGAARMKR